MQDKQLIKQYLYWNKESLEELLEKHLQTIFASCYRVCLDESDANDITQNVLIKIIKNLHKFSFKSSFKTWYYRISYNESITYLKKNKWFTNIEEIEQNLVFEEDKSADIDKEIQKNKITKEINKLPLIERNIILLFYYDELKIKEISRIIWLNENTIKTKLHRTKKKLKSNLEKIWKTL